MASAYAKILVEKSDPLKTLFFEVSDFNNALSPKFVTFLKTPQISKESKIKVINNLNLSSDLNSILEVAIYNNAIYDIINLAKDYESYLQTQYNLKVVTIEFASDVEKGMESKILKKIKHDFKIDHIIVKATSINPKLISGFRIKSINSEYDYSIAYELELRKRLLIKEYHGKNT